MQLPALFFKFQVSCPNMAILKIGPYLRNSCPQSKSKLNFDPLGQKRIAYTTFGTFFKFQVSCPNMVILKIGPYLENGCLQSNNKVNFDPVRENESTHTTLGPFFKFLQIPSCPNMEIYKISQYLRNCDPYRHGTAKMSSI